MRKQVMVLLKDKVIFMLFGLGIKWLHYK